MTDLSIKKFLCELKQLSQSESIPCVGGLSDLPAQPGLKVKGRQISLPVNQEDLEWLCHQGQNSPFGKGMETVFDANIRRSIELEAQDIELLNPHWNSALENLLNSVSEQMGIDFQIKAELFKLLVYQEGGHFKFHQDTEKAPGMFATLIIQLPSRCQGGSLVCRFAEKEYHFDFGNKARDSEFSIYYAAHYADVQHQVEKITKGARLVLIYNLIQPIKERQLSANHHEKLLNSAKDMASSIFSLFSQEQHTFLLQHEYTEQSLSDLGFLAMKGQDRSLVKSLVSINEHLPLEQKLYFMISRVSYSVTSDGYGGHYRDCDEDDMDWEEIESSDPDCEICFDEDGHVIPVGHFSIDWIHDLNGKEIDSIAFDRVDDNFWGEGDDYIEGYMGNYGPTKETTYARHLLAVMPAYPNKPDISQDPVLQAHRVSLMAQDLCNYSDCSWLQERFSLALKKVLTQFTAIIAENKASSYWRSDFDKSTQAVFIKLLKTAIVRDDYALCQDLINTAREVLIEHLSSEFQAKNILVLLKDAIDHFGWKALAASYIPLLSTLSGNAVLQASIALSEGNSDIDMRVKMMDLCADAVCREKKSWGGQCSFQDTILPFAANLCKTEWHASAESKALFLDTCLEKSAKHPSFLSVLIQKLVANKESNDKQWLLNPLITSRLKYLEGEFLIVPKEFTWAMPDAKVRKAAITAFLRSEAQEVQITGYDGIAMARKDEVIVEHKWILPEFYMESNADFLQPRKNYGFSATMQAKGRGKSAYVEIKKDKRYYDLCLKLRELRKREFEKLKHMIEPE